MLNGFTEFNYLSAQKVGAYRQIMRFFYDSHLMQRSTLPPEDVLLVLGGNDLGGSDLGGSDLDGVLFDLEALVAWGTLGKRRDGRRVGTLTEYARRRNLHHAARSEHRRIFGRWFGSARGQRDLANWGDLKFGETTDDDCGADLYRGSQ